MFFPIRTDRRLQHTPWVNYSLIALNVAVYLWSSRVDDRFVAPYLLDPVEPRLLQFFTYQFLHADVWHILGNMVFLYVFGSSVEDRLGKLGYLGFYLAGGVLSGLAHSALADNPVLGASGAICGVTGAYLALFPLTQVTIVYFFFIIGAFEITSMVLILFQVAQNLVLTAAGGGGVAYMAHLGGYVYGFIVGMGLLATRLLPREPYDLLAMIERHRRRQQFRGMVKQGYRPWDAEANAAVAADKPVSPEQQRIMSLRSRIHAALTAHEMADAAGLYRELVQLDDQQVLGQQPQLDIANQLMSEGRHDHAARAYELFLKAHPRYAQREQIELILGLIYARYLHRRQRAAELLTAALPRLDDAQQKDLARQTLSMVQG